MAYGSVKWFDDAKGFGFLTPDESIDDLYVHFSAIKTQGLMTLKAGQRVTFEISQTSSGIEAALVCVVPS